MTKKIIWRLKEQPSSESLRSLVKDGILTKEEAREILFSQETEETIDKKSLESEIRFLRELVEKLSNSNNSRIVEIIREVEKPYYKYDWYRPYTTWCGDVDTMTSSLSQYTVSDGAKSPDVGSVSYASTSPWSNFSDIKTF